jgi:hypothetical protein
MIRYKRKQSSMFRCLQMIDHILRLINTHRHVLVSCISWLSELNPCVHMHVPRRLKTFHHDVIYFFYFIFHPSNYLWSHSFLIFWKDPVHCIFWNDPVHCTRHKLKMMESVSGYDRTSTRRNVAATTKFRDSFIRLFYYASVRHCVPRETLILSKQKRDALIKIWWKTL